MFHNFVSCKWLKYCFSCLKQGWIVRLAHFIQQYSFNVSNWPSTWTFDRFPYQPPFAWDILKAADEVGFGVTEDLVGDKITGFSVAQTISKSGVRTTTARSYITPVADRPNLHVAINATVTKVNIVDKKATGIEVLIVRRCIEFER